MKPMPVSLVREHLTHLEKVMEPGEVLEVCRRGRPYFEIKLAGPKKGEDPYEILDRALKHLPPARGKKKDIARRADEYLYGWSADKPSSP